MIWTLAHEGGWDEFLYFAVPIVLAVLVIRRLEKKRPSPPETPQEDSESQNTTP